MIIIKEYYSRGNKIKTKYGNTETPDKEFDTLIQAQAVTKTIRFESDD